MLYDAPDSALLVGVRAEAAPAGRGGGSCADRGLRSDRQAAGKSTPRRCLTEHRLLARQARLQPCRATHSSATQKYVLLPMPTFSSLSSVRGLSLMSQAPSAAACSSGFLNP